MAEVSGVRQRGCRKRRKRAAGPGEVSCSKPAPQPWGTSWLVRISNGFIPTSRTPTGETRSYVSGNASASPFTSSCPRICSFPRVSASLSFPSLSPPPPPGTLAEGSEAGKDALGIFLGFGFPGGLPKYPDSLSKSPGASRLLTGSERRQGAA